MEVCHLLILTQGGQVEVTGCLELDKAIEILRAERIRRQNLPVQLPLSNGKVGGKQLKGAVK